MSMRHSFLRRSSILILVVLFLGGNLFAATPVNSTLANQGEQIMPVMETEDLSTPQGVASESLLQELLAKAAPDECYAGIGNAYPPGPPCEQGVPKVNQAYVWGLAKTGNLLWFGTAPNVHCLVFGGYFGVTMAHEADSWVCEFGESQYSPPLPAAAGDWRPTHIYVYDLQSRTLEEVSPHDPLFATSSGIRSAGALGSLVILGGPSLMGGITLFAYDSDTQAYLGSANLPEFTNIRKWLVVDGVLYTAVRNASGGGSVLRWQGDLENPFEYEIVGNLDSEGAELALHAGRIFVSTWPDLTVQPPALAGIFMSPLIPEGGLTSADADGWLKVWQSDDYDPDPLIAATYGGGALASFDGYLYWGTMHVPFLAALAHINVYGAPQTQLGVLNVILQSHRAISIFRGRDFGSPSEEISLLYGQEYLTMYDYDPDAGSGSWTIAMNNMSSEPLYGDSGFGNFYNNYTWTMAVYEHQLYVGTMDYSYVFRDGLILILETILGIPPIGDPAISFPNPIVYGADLFRFTDSAEPAVAESQDGVGNYSNYGIRTMLSGDALYLGTANPMNLMTDLQDDKPEGGWELIKLYETLESFLPLVWR